MDSGVIAAAIIVVAVAVGVIAFWAHMRGRVHPEDTASHEDGRTIDRRVEARTAPYGGTDRPAGPDAEGMAAPRTGQVVPGSGPPNDNNRLAPDPNLSHVSRRSSRRPTVR